MKKIENMHWKMNTKCEAYSAPNPYMRGIFRGSTLFSKFGENDKESFCEVSFKEILNLKYNM